MMRKRSVPGANKTFGMRYPLELLAKLVFDLDRLKQAKFSREATYAVFDCATDAWHMVDWCLAYADDQQIKSWTGRERNSKTSLTAGFVETNTDFSPHLGYCQLIANSFKHLVINFDDENLTSHNSVRFDPAFQADVIQEITMSPVSNIVHLKSGNHFDARIMFADLVHKWDQFLKREGLDFSPDDDLEEEIKRALFKQ